MRILIVDDEPLARERLRALVDELQVGEVVAMASNGMEALTAVEQSAPDIVLLDIRMPGMDGLEAARHLAKRARPPAVIFTTAFDDHALEAFDANAVDYLLKPIRKERLRRGLDKAAIQPEARLTRLSAADAETQPRTHLSAASKGGLRLMPVADVRFLRAEHKYVTAVSPGGELLLDESLVLLEREFAGRFARVHRNALAALDHVETLDARASALSFRGVKATLRVSRRYLPSVREALRVR